MIYREWKVREADTEKGREMAECLARQGCGDAGLLCKVLAARGFGPEDAALLAKAPPLPDPMLMKGMDAAVKRIRAALEQEELIAVFGDYDVDGITATALLYTYLESQGASVFYKLPSRSDSGYGLSPAQVDAMADRGITLVITVDNGTTAFEAAARAKERGVSLVVTDHHLPYDSLPPVDALVNPHRADDESGLAALSGAGVAFMLLAALEECCAEELLPVFGDLAAIGTVADVMKLLGPNRVIVKAGLSLMQDIRRPGLAALLENCGHGEREITAETVSYAIAPRLNAAGRMDDATDALRLLLTEDEQEAAALAEGLGRQNAARQKAEGEILEAIDAQMAACDGLRRSRVLVIWGEGWHQGVIGIVASRLTDKYAKPVIVISFENGEGRGSGRSVAGFPLYDAIAACGEVLIRYGGHDLAAGFSLKSGAEDKFRAMINAWAAQHAPAPAPQEIWADAQVCFKNLTVAEVRALELLSPYGSGNPSPKFLVSDALVEAVDSVSEGKHCRLRLAQAAGAISAVRFGCPPQSQPYKAGSRVDALIALSVYGGRTGPQLSARILEIRPAGMQNVHVAQSLLFEQFCAGARLTAQQCAALTPKREDAAALYRLARDGGGICGSDLRPVFAKFGEDAAGRILTALAALEELGLLCRDGDGTLRVPQVNGRRSLADSRILQRLEVARA